jgi:hypothetical protein
MLCGHWGSELGFSKITWREFSVFGLLPTVSPLH